MFSISYCNGKNVVTAGDKNITIWDSETLQCVLDIEGHDDRINCIDFSPNGELFVTGSSDQTFKIWNLDGECIKTFYNGVSPICYVGFSPDRNLIATGNEAGYYRIWNPFSGGCIYERYIGNIRANAFCFGEHIVYYKGPLQGTIFFKSFPTLEKLIELATEYCKDLWLSPEERVKYYLD